MSGSKKVNRHLIKKILRGDSDAFESLIQHYQKKAYAIAYSLGVPRSGLDDVVQEAFFKPFAI